MKPFKNRIFKRRLVGERLKKAIHQRNYTYSEFADRIGLSSPTISNFIHGNSDPSVDTLYCMAQELGVSCDWLLGLADFPYRSM